jgi:alkylhydroperoxidase/carboxymuconolactone decarboxylase family protein YurZ
MSVPEFFFERPIDEFVIASETDEELMQSVTEMLREVIKKKSIDKKTKELIILPMLSVLNFESGFKFHAKEALRSGASKEQLLEACELLVPYFGIPIFLRAVKWLRDLKIV